MHKISQTVWFARWALRLGNNLLRRSPIIDLLPPFIARSRRYFYDRRLGHFRRLRVRNLLSDYWAYDQSIVCANFDYRRFPQFSVLQARYDRIVREGRVPLIIDCGANIGMSAYWFATQFPAARVLAVEPDSANAEMARANNEAFPQVQVLQAAVAPVDCKVTLLNTDKGADAFRTEMSADGSIDAYSIVSLARIAKLEVRDLFIVKVDIEGFEDVLFESDTDWIAAAELVIVEPHDWMISGKAKANNMLRALSRTPRDFLINGEHVLSFRLPDGAADRA